MPIELGEFLIRPESTLGYGFRFEAAGSGHFYDFFVRFAVQITRAGG